MTSTDDAYAEIAERAKGIDPERFSSCFTYGSIMDPYCLGYEGEDNVGRIWWVRDPANDGPPVTAWDFLEVHPEITWDEIYAREEAWSRRLAPW